MDDPTPRGLGAFTALADDIVFYGLLSLAALIVAAILAWRFLPPELLDLLTARSRPTPPRDPRPRPPMIRDAEAPRIHGTRPRRRDTRDRDVRRY